MKYLLYWAVPKSIISLFDSDPIVFLIFGDNQRCPLDIALTNPHITLRIIKLLLNGWSESISMVNGRNRNLPIHLLCSNEELDEAVSVDILKILIEASPESVQREASDFELTIHEAAWYGKSPEFLKILVNAYPESVGIQSGEEDLPIQLACKSDNCRLDAVKYLLDIYPESINVESYGWLPIHYASSSNNDTPQKADIIEHLLMKDPACASKLTDVGKTPLHLACYSQPNLIAIQILFDAYPEAVLKRDETGRLLCTGLRNTTEMNEIIIQKKQQSS